MQTLTKEEIINLNNLSETFTSLTLGSEIPGGMCFNISYVLHLHLQNNGIKTSIRSGKVGKTDHFWLSLEDDVGTIIDPTRHQFNSPKPQKLVEVKPEYYEESPFTFDVTYKYWRDPLM